MAIPSGTVTFLFSDIEGSTTRWEAHREAMQLALARHDALLRAALERNGGYVFKTVGDEFCTAFDDPERAIAAAIDAQRELHADDWSAVDGLRVRMAIHTGVVEHRDNDYFGPPVNRVARLLATAHGEQIVLSQAAAALAHALPAAATLRDLGKHRLKDLPTPETVFQLDVEGMRGDFPPLRAVDVSPTNLPLHLTALLGREHEMTEIETLLNDVRLVTITGSGGVGKTRTALQVASNALPSFTDGAWVVELAPISDGELLASTIAQALRVEIASNRPALEELAIALKEKRLLVVVDNCEHVVAAAAQTVEQLLQRCPYLRFLATSREALGVRGEHTFRLPSLDGATGVALFVERARAVKREFSLNGNAPIVAEIVSRLDGIPLAIELAASRAKVLSVDRIREGLNERFKLLSGGSRTALPRQQTLHAMIGWSYDLLDDAEAAMFRQLSVFRGPWTLEATAAVCAMDDWDALPLLESLVEKSLVNADAQGDEPRYRMLESTRAFALERSRETGEHAEAARRHCAYYRERSERSLERYWRIAIYRWRAEMVADVDNYRAAIEWALDEGNDVESGVTIEANLSWLSLPDHRRLIARAKDALPSDASQRLRGKVEWAYARRGSDDENVLESSQRAAEIFERTGDRVEWIQATLHVAVSLWRLGRVQEAVEHAERLLSAAREQHLPHLLGYVLSHVGYLLVMGGQQQRGREYLEESIALLRGLDDRMRLGFPLGNLAEARFSTGDAEGAVAAIREALELDIETSSPHSAMFDRVNMAAYLLALGRVSEAESNARDALESALSRNERFPVTVSIGHLAHAAAEKGAVERAARLIGFADKTYAGLGFPREPTERSGYDRTMEILRVALDEVRLHSLIAEGAGMSQDEAVRVALAPWV